MKLNAGSRASCFVLHSTDTSIYVMRGPEILLHFSRPNRYSVWRLTPGSLTPESGLLFIVCLHEFLCVSKGPRVKQIRLSDLSRREPCANRSSANFSPNVAA